MPYEVFMGLRYLRARRKQTVISVVTGIAVFGVALGVFALITVIAVMSGFQKDLRDKILGSSSHVVVVASTGDPVDEGALRETILADPDVVAAAPFIYSKILISHRNQADGILVKGIDPAQVGAVTDLERNIISGSLESLAETREDAEPGILLGIELAGNLRAGVGDVVKLVLPDVVPGPSGGVPRMRRFRVTGIFNAGMFEYDSGMAYIDLSAARRLFRGGNGVQGFEIKVREIFRASAVARRLQKALGFRYVVRDWSEMNRAFFAALKLEKQAMFLILVLIILVAAFNIVGTLTMMVMEKHRDIGILKSMGASARSILAIFLTQGLSIGVLGTLIGGVTGVAACLLGDRYHLISLQSEVYYLSYLPFRLEPADLIAICSASLLISLLATIYPAWQASRLDPVEAIRYE
jgi:lipoprotein-releasing system permease protein